MSKAAACGLTKMNWRISSIIIIWYWNIKSMNQRFNFAFHIKYCVLCAVWSVYAGCSMMYAIMPLLYVYGAYDNTFLICLHVRWTNYDFSSATGFTMKTFYQIETFPNTKIEPEWYNFKSTNAHRYRIHLCSRRGRSMEFIQIIESKNEIMFDIV